MEWNDLENLIKIYDAQEICLIAEVDKDDTIISKVIMGDLRGDGMSDEMFKEMFDCEEKLAESDKFLGFETESGRVFKYIT